MHRFIVRQAQRRDFENIYRLARLLNSVNLPYEETALYKILEKSEMSFNGSLPPLECEYLFVLEDLEKAQVIGSSGIIARHGTESHPHLYFTVKKETNTSVSLGKSKENYWLQLGEEREGMTEIGRLVLLPEYRKLPEKLGFFLSYVRFLFMGMFADRFCKRVLAELLPPLPSGESVLWESLGRHFTDMDYQYADHLSRENKEFILNLFPKKPIPMSLLKEEAQEVIGQVGENNRGAKSLLSAIGFVYSGRVDPFDGGPHYEAELSEISLVKNAHSARLAPLRGRYDFPDTAYFPSVMLATFTQAFQKKGEFRAIKAEAYCELNRGLVFLEVSAMESLGVKEGETVFWVNLSS